MAPPPPQSDRTEALAFQLILDKLVTLEQAVTGLVPLLEKIVRHLEAQKPPADVPIATPAQLYAELRESEPVAVEGTPIPAEVVPPRRLRWGMRTRP